ncbi:hypothetical protein BUALT_Bualt02G0188100 [Buddleja alternifolia]|uniref:Uncharacterized protein n=1 Tax=Buddleja alternifolia TaxID=168488 RepID=A0AAV6Y853_9LAMI|nr:hypothetical protein BUALT_Bualt02G0188100 [Buddleja alternifolia]
MLLSYLPSSTSLPPAFLFMAQIDGAEVVMMVYCYSFMPETKNIPIEEITQVWREHWYWRMYMINDPDDPVNKAGSIGMTRSNINQV